MERGKRQRPTGDEGNEVSMAVSEEEVEEFVAILRRIHEVAKCGGRTVRGLVTEERKSRKMWRPEFTWEDFEEVKTAKHNGRTYLEELVTAEREAKGITRAIDLNADPE